MKTLARAQKLGKCCKFSSIRQFFVHSGDHPPAELTYPTSSNPPAWKRLIGSTVSTEVRTCLIKSTFSDRDEAKAFEYIYGNDAQAFVDVIDEASIFILLLLSLVGRFPLKLSVRL